MTVIVYSALYASDDQQIGRHINTILYSYIISRKEYSQFLILYGNSYSAVQVGDVKNISNLA